MKSKLYTGPSKKPCKHPGCRAVLHWSTSTFDTGYCKNHGGMHKGRAEVAPVAAVERVTNRPDVRGAVVQLSGMAGGSTIEPKMVRVSLPREPWL